MLCKILRFRKPLLLLLAALGIVYLIAALHAADRPRSPYHFDQEEVEYLTIRNSYTYTTLKITDRPRIRRTVELLNRFPVSHIQWAPSYFGDIPAVTLRVGPVSNVLVCFEPGYVQVRVSERDIDQGTVLYCGPPGYFQELLDWAAQGELYVGDS